MRILLFLLLTISPLFSHPPHQDHKTIAQMTAGAKSFLRALTPEQKATAIYPFDTEERENWRYVPVDHRNGIGIGALTPAQRPFVFAMLSTGLSEQGLLTASTIIALEQYLAEKENDPVRRDPEKYYLTIFGTPSQDTTWGWRFEGHHLSLNFTIIEGKEVIFTPAFFGTNPAEILKGPLKGQRPLGVLEDRARAFIAAVAPQHPSAIFSEKPPKEIISRQERTAKQLEPLGVAGKDLTEPQQIQFQEMINTIKIYFDHGLLPEDKLNAATARFAWGGSTERGKAHYFRIQSPDVLIEYANTQNNANHAHFVIRFTENDFGRDLLKEHFEKDHRDD